MSNTLLLLAGLSAAAGIAYAVDQFLLHGVWAAGYWWSKHYREHGPGC